MATVEKFVREDFKIVSTASSTSERSSRTDSFYDITTAHRVCLIWDSKAMDYGKRTYTSRHGKNARHSSEEEDHNVIYSKGKGLPTPVLQTKGLIENGLNERDEEGDDEYAQFTLTEIFYQTAVFR
ncbi:AIF_collapsed_G0010930.mRNA.1.CDS.1 [Saccharomyces cerevisiae]|nr:AIF_collapsed_G0010930.mRNA.1.CDS.1 [Saccharomyces cerevisiae]